MTDAIVIVLTLALAALVLWLPVALVRSWARPRVWSRRNGLWGMWPVPNLPAECIALHEPIGREASDPYDWLTELNRLRALAGEAPYIRVQPHTRAGRAVKGYCRRIKR